MIFVTIGIIVAETILIVLLLRTMYKQDYDGAMVVKETPEKKIFSLELNGDPEKMEYKKHIVFEVKHFSEEATRE